MNRKRITVLFMAALSVGAAFYWFHQAEPDSVNSIDQSSSLKDESGSEIQLPPQNNFHKKQPQRDIQSEEARMRPRNPARQNQVLKPSPQFKVEELKLQNHEALQDTPWQIWTDRKPVLKGQAAKKESVEISQYAVIPNGEDKVSLEQFDPAAPIVVFDARRKIPGILTGTFVITLRDEANPEVLTSDQAIRILQSFPEIHTYFVTSKEVPFNFLQFKRSLLERGAIANVETEVLSRKYDKF